MIRSAETAADADGDADRELDRAPARLAAGEAERDDRGGRGEERLRLADDQLRQRPGDPGGDGGLQDRPPGPGDEAETHPRRAAEALLESPVAGRHLGERTRGRRGGAGARILIGPTRWLRSRKAH
jgi:hypothetical protein